MNLVNPNNHIFERHKGHLEEIERELVKFIDSRVGLVEDMGRHTLLARGKRLRPLLFVLSSELCSYRGENLHRFAVVFETIHAASLLHDDVLDHAEIRRKKPAANRLWGNQAAILEGDYLYAKASTIALESGNLPFLKVLVDTITRMAEGQILELIHMHTWETSLETYMEIITAKTAVLISAACAAGAILAGAEEKRRAHLERFGLNMGIAFQLIDDLLDYTSSAEVFGKPVGKDLREGKVTLPLIYTIPRIREKERDRLRALFMQHQPGEDDYNYVIELVRSNGALERIRDEAESYVDEAEKNLQIFPDSSAKSDLLQLNRSLMKRTY